MDEFYFMLCFPSKPRPDLGISPWVAKLHQKIVFFDEIQRVGHLWGWATYGVLLPTVFPFSDPRKISGNSEEIPRNFSESFLSSSNHPSPIVNLIT